VYLPSLHLLNVESNQIKTVPPEICLLKNLKNLLIGQNSIRSIPGDVISGGHVKLINFLKNRLPDDYEEPDWVSALRSDGKGKRCVSKRESAVLLTNLFFYLFFSVSFLPSFYF
jgi:Leucine-rich repeat (LRR) protein